MQFFIYPRYLSVQCVAGSDFFFLLFFGWCLHSVIVSVASQKLLNFTQLHLSSLGIICSWCSICKALLIFYLAFLALLYTQVWFGSNESPLFHLLVNKSCWGQFRPLQSAMENKLEVCFKMSLECLLSNLNYSELFVLLRDSMGWQKMQYVSAPVSQSAPDRHTQDTTERI